MIRWAATALACASIVVSLALLLPEPGAAAEALRAALNPSHALGELPHVVVGGLFFVAGLAPGAGWKGVGRVAAAALAAGLGLGAWAAAQDGASAAWEHAVQRRAASDLAGDGAHFRYHVLSDVALAALLYAAGRLCSGGQRTSLRNVPAAAGTLLFAAMAGLFGLADALSPRFLGHQAREILTHGLVTVPALVGWELRDRAAATEALREPAARAALLLAALLAAGMAWALAGRDLAALSATPGRPLTANAAAHNLEHLIDLALLALLARAGTPRPAETSP